MKMLRVLFRRQCIDHEGLHNPVDQWRAGGGRPHRPRRRRIAVPAEVLPGWHRGFETAVRNDVAREAFRFGLYTGMRRAEVFGLEWARVDLDRGVLHIADTKSGEPLEFPFTRQLAAILERRLGERERFAAETRGWVFLSELSGSGHLECMQHLNARIGEAGGANFWFHALRNCIHQRRRPRPDAAAEPDQAPRQPLPAPGRDRGLRRGLDHGAASRRRAAYRRSDRRTHSRRRTGAGGPRSLTPGAAPASPAGNRFDAHRGME